MIGGYVLAGTWSERKNVVLKNIMGNKTMIRVPVSRVMIKNTCVRVSLVLTGRDWWGKAWRGT